MLNPLIKRHFLYWYNVELTYRLSYIHTYIPLTLYTRRGSRGISDIASRPTFYQNYLAVRNTADVTDGKPIAVLSQSISGVNAINPVVALYDIHGRKREVLFFFSRAPHETIDKTRHG
jgi:hypothetical protein